MEKEKIAGLLLAGGKSQRFDSEKPKYMFDYKEKPIILDSVTRMTDVGIEQIYIVVRASYLTEIEKLIRSDSQLESVIKPVVQYKGFRLVDGLFTGISALQKESINPEYIFLMLADEIILSSREKEAVATAMSKKLDGIVGVYKPDSEKQIQQTYSVPNDYTPEYIEKPDLPTGTYMGTGNVILRYSSLIDLISRTNVNELVDILNLLKHRGARLEHYEVGTFYSNINTKEELKKLNQHSSSMT